MATIEQQYHDACKLARDESQRDECTKHVNAKCGVVYGVPTIVGFRISDWYNDGSTLASFTDGKEQ